MAETPALQLRMPVELRERARSAAKARGQTLSAFIRDAVMAHLEYDEISSDGVIPTSPTCLHDNRRILAYGTWCRDCGTRLR